jgi:hypothetical protein
MLFADDRDRALEQSLTLNDEGAEGEGSVSRGPVADANTSLGRTCRQQGVSRGDMTSHLE